MEWKNWVPALTSTGVLAALFYLLRDVFLRQVEHDIKHSFDKKLEALRAEFRESEEHLKSELRSREAEIESLRNRALSDAATRRHLFSKRSAEAADDLWGNVVSLSKAKGIARQLSAFNLNAVGKRVPTEPKLAQIFGMIAGGFDLEELNTTAAQRARPHLPEIMWALFSAYSTIVSIAIAQAKLLSAGTENVSGMMKHDSIKVILKAALPERSAEINQLAPEEYFDLLDTLETNLLSKLREFISGTEADYETIEQSAKILRAVHAAPSTNPTNPQP